MANLAEKLRTELTERAKNSESCKKYLLDWVMNQFRNGRNPVYIYCSNMIYQTLRRDWIERCGVEFKEHVHRTLDLKYEEGKHFARIGSKNWADVTDTEIAQCYACDGRDESDKTLFLQSEGFGVSKRWIRGEGTVLEITF